MTPAGRSPLAPFCGHSKIVPLPKTRALVIMRKQASYHLLSKNRQNFLTRAFMDHPDSALTQSNE